MVTDEHTGMVLMKTRVGGTRVVDMLSGEQLSPEFVKSFQPKVCVRTLIALPALLAGPRLGPAESLEKISRTIRRTPST